MTKGKTEWGDRGTGKDNSRQTSQRRTGKESLLSGVDPYGRKRKRAASVSGLLSSCPPQSVLFGIAFMSQIRS